MRGLIQQQKLENMSKLSKAERLAGNLRIMLKGTRPSSLRINRRNEKALRSAIELIGRRVDEFRIEVDSDDFSYLEIRLRQDPRQSMETSLFLLNRPTLPRNL